jgi:hypothetical protein
MGAYSLPETDASLTQPAKQTVEAGAQMILALWVCETQKLNQLINTGECK